MRTTITLDDTLFERAVAITGDHNASSMLTKALEMVVASESKKRLIRLSGKAPEFIIPGRDSRATDPILVAEDENPYNSTNPKMNVLADTNIWCRYFREGQETLSSLIEFDFLAIHPPVIGELSVGNLPSRKQTLIDLNAFHPVRPASFEETHHLIEENKLWGKGLQWDDLAILASVLASDDLLLWTEDKRLAEAASHFGIRYDTT